MKKFFISTLLFFGFLFVNAQDLLKILEEQVTKPIEEFQKNGDKNKTNEFYSNLIKNISQIQSPRAKKFVAKELFQLISSEKNFHMIKLDLGDLIVKNFLSKDLEEEFFLNEMYKIADDYYASFDIKNKNEMQEALIRRSIIEEQLINLYIDLGDYSKSYKWYNNWVESYKEIRQYKLLITFAQKNVYYDTMVDNIKKLGTYTSNHKGTGNNEIHLKNLGYHLLTGFKYAEPALSYISQTSDVELIEIATITCKYNNFQKKFDATKKIGDSTLRLPNYAKIIFLEQTPEYANSAEYIKNAIASQPGSERVLNEIIHGELNKIKTNTTITNEEFYKLINWAMNDKNISNRKNQYFFLKHLENGFTMIDNKDPRYEEIKNNFLTITKNLAIINKVENKRNPPAPEPDVDPKVVKWLATPKEERERIKSQVIDQLQQANRNKTVSVRIDVDRLSLDIEHNSDLTNPGPLAQIPFKHVSINHIQSITDYSFLSGLPIQTLVLDWSGFSELGYIQNIKSLRRLQISGTGVRNLTKLKGLTLTHFYASRLKIPNIDALEGMPLEELNISHTPITTLKPITYAPLVYLDASNCSELKDIAALEQTDLKRLYLNNADKINNLYPISELFLTELSIENTAVADLTPLARMPLENLYFARNQRIRSIAPLKWMELKNLTINNALMLPTVVRYNFPLRYLGLPETNIQDISILKNFDIINLDLSGCPYVKDLRPLKYMKLQELNISNCKSLRTFKGIEETEITRLIADNTIVRDLTSLMGSKVKDLRIMHSEVVSLKGIEKTEVTRLDARWSSKLKDISSLEGSSIKELLIRGTNPSDLNPISKMPNLKYSDTKP